MPPERKPPIASPAAGENRLYQTVARRIGQLMLQNADDAQWRMPTERDLAEILGVSRPVVREAIIALEMRGLVEVRGRAGIVVRKGSTLRLASDAASGDIGPGPFELLEARLAVEPFAASLAAERVTGYDLSLLGECIVQMETEARDAAANEKGDERFHVAIAQITGNGLIVDMVRRLWKLREESAMWKKLHERIYPPAIRTLWIGDHHAIVAALRMRNGPAAAKAMSRHLENVVRELVDADEPGAGLRERA